MDVPHLDAGDHRSHLGGLKSVLNGCGDLSSDAHHVTQAVWLEIDPVVHLLVRNYQNMAGPDWRFRQVARSVALEQAGDERSKKCPRNAPEDSNAGALPRTHCILVSIAITWGR